MQSFKITREELLKFAQRIYNEGCYGYLDLCESTADKMVTDFLDGREPITPGILNPNAFVGMAAVGMPPTMIGMDPAASPPQQVWHGGPPTFAPNVDSSVNVTITAGGPPDPQMTEYTGHSGPAYEAAMAAQVQAGGPHTAPSGAPLQYDAEQGVLFHEETITGNSEGVVLTETPVIREQVFVRTENYVGNQSERL